MKDGNKKDIGKMHLMCLLYPETTYCYDCSELGCVDDTLEKLSSLHQIKL